MIEALMRLKVSNIFAACILISCALVFLNGCSMSDFRAPEAYPVNIIPVNSKFQDCAKSCLDEYAQCTAKQSGGYLSDLQNSTISECRNTYKECMLACRKTYKEIFN